MIFKHVKIYQNVITQAQAKQIIDYINPKLARRKYEGNHWDDVIFQYKEMVMHIPTGKCELDSIIQNLLELVTSESCTFANTNSSKRMMPIHVIDLGEAGSIAPHIDSVKASGSLIAGLSLLSSRVLRLQLSQPDLSTPTRNKCELEKVAAGKIHGVETTTDLTNLDLHSATKSFISNNFTFPTAIEFYLEPRSLYILEGPLRYNYTHAILGKDCDKMILPKLEPVNRRISLMFRDELSTNT